MKPRDQNSIYPDANRGSLSENHDSYIKPKQAKGPKRSDIDNKIIVFGLLFFVIFLMAFAFAAGIGNYL